MEIEVGRVFEAVAGRLRRAPERLPLTAEVGAGGA
jgi:hypothetical protein